MLNARPHLNGNTPEHFAEAYAAIYEAQMAVQKAHSALLCYVVNGRNYQHLGRDGTEMLQKDGNRIAQDITQIQRLLGEIGSDIVDAHSPQG